MPRPYRGPKRLQIIAYVPPHVKSYIRYMAAAEPGGSETEFISRVLTADYNRALEAGEPVAKLVAELGEDHAGQNLEGS
jgi:hypothetical protein